MVIEIIVKNDDNEIVGKKVAFSFESAEENLGKLERFVTLHQVTSDLADMEYGTIDGLSAEEAALAFRPERVELIH